MTLPQERWPLEAELQLGSLQELLGCWQGYLLRETHPQELALLPEH